MLAVAAYVRAGAVAIAQEMAKDKIPEADSHVARLVEQRAAIMTKSRRLRRPGRNRPRVDRP